MRIIKIGLACGLCLFVTSWAYAGGAVTRVKQQKQMMMQQKMMQEAAIKRRKMEQIAGQKAVMQQQARPAASEEVQQIVNLDQLLQTFEESSRAWPLIIDMEAKEAVVQAHIARFRQQNVLIRKSPGHYAQMVDTMAAQTPEMLRQPFLQILQVVAVTEYDFDNGQDKDALARKVLSPQAFRQNKERLGLSY